MQVSLVLVVLAIALFFGLPSTFGSGESPVYQIEVINQFPHDTEAFTQGLVFVDGKLYEGTGQRGQSALRLLDLETGELLQRKNLERRYFGEGITILGDKIYQLTWVSNVGFVYDKESFTQLSSFYLPGEGWGITHDGEYLIVSDGSSYLRFLDPESLTEVKRIQVTDELGAVANINELEYINGEIWGNIWYQDYIVRIDPESGAVNSRVDLSGLYTARRNRDAVLNGIAWDADNERLFVTGKLWPSLYEIKVLE
jgi:glutamine cyclotransferase